jgi:hypothetical protein
MVSTAVSSPDSPTRPSTPDNPLNTIYMPRLKGTVKKIFRKNKKPHRAGSDAVSSSASSVYSQSTAELEEAGSSSYSRTPAGYGFLHPPDEDQGRVRPDSRISWLDNIVSNSCGYTAQVDDAPAGPDPDHYQQSFMTNAAAARTCPLVIPPGNDETRAKRFLGSLRRSRPHSIYCRPKEVVHTDLDLFQTPRLATQLNPIEYVDVGKETKQEIRRIKIIDALSSKFAISKARNAFVTGCSTLQTLYEQGEWLQNTENNLSGAVDASDEGARKLKALRRANKMIRISDSSAATTKTLAIRQNYRKNRDSERALKWRSWKAAEIHTFANVPLHQGGTTHNMLAQAKYQFEPDSDDDDLENVIDGNVDALTVAVSNLRNVACDVGSELIRQNDKLRQTGRVVGSLDDELASKASRLQWFWEDKT